MGEGACLLLASSLQQLPSRDKHYETWRINMTTLHRILWSKVILHFEQGSSTEVVALEYWIKVILQYE